MAEYLLKNLTFIDCTGAAPQGNAAVVIVDNRIKDVVFQANDIRLFAETYTPIIGVGGISDSGQQKKHLKSWEFAEIAGKTSV